MTPIEFESLGKMAKNFNVNQRIEIDTKKAKIDKMESRAMSITSLKALQSIADNKIREHEREMMVQNRGLMEKVYVAIDTYDMETAKYFAQILDGRVGGLKFGLEFFVANGPQGIAKVMKDTKYLDVFLDLKFKDIPNTVAGALMSAVTAVNAKFVNIHLDGGRKMVKLAAETLKKTETKILGVTVLTSMEDKDFQEIFNSYDITEQVMCLANIANQSGLHGVVCSPKDIAYVKGEYPDLIIMAPGIRPNWAESNDQKRFTTPKEAIDLGADYIVIGRPITNPPKGLTTIDAVNKIKEELEEVNDR